ncbi:MAG: GGDEF domain-containing protein [Sulfurimonas sp.]|nr:GGDEF domain-containing protein [Sulfurimonas sp.]MBU3938761.1 GGDEF domain-containing protein [bacterium]MBU4024190.1 GGDEF domain-containing protein [bacterium]MBU4058782.1 GGDEF domain-containing protein [bacterium]
MENNLSKLWRENLELLDFAFQPILNTHTGKIFAVEALLRNYENIGYKSIFSLFDDVYKNNLLYAFDIMLRNKAIEKFVTIKNYKDIKLFYNLDNRLFEMQDFTKGNTLKILKKFDLNKNALCFEISERHEIACNSNLENVINHYKESDFCIAIDDFGVGYSGYKLLYDMLPNIIKIDRFFLANLEKDAKKRVMVKSICNLAIQLGIKIIAEGVETKEELLVCKEIGCHYIQGYFIQRPTQECDEILNEYEHIKELVQIDKRSKNSIQAYLDKIETLNIHSQMSDIIEYFNKNKQISILPIVSANNEPYGIIQENKIKEYLYSPYGHSLLLKNNADCSKIKNLITPCGITDLDTSLSNIIELFSSNPESVGIIITKDTKYYGFLSARAIITVMNEKNLIYARDQNPLTKLPGNSMIEEYIAKIDTMHNSYILCYFDLDNFKAYNDVYGFRNGDRVLLLFSEILKKHFSCDYFVAHIGGDDFFSAVSFHGMDENIFIDEICQITNKFTHDVQSFYNEEDKNKGYIEAKDREGNMKNFPLLSVSTSILIVRKSTTCQCEKDINAILSQQKKYAKNELDHISISSLI